MNSICWEGRGTGPTLEASARRFQRLGKVEGGLKACGVSRGACALLLTARGPPLGVLELRECRRRSLLCALTRVRQDFNLRSLASTASTDWAVAAGRPPLLPESGWGQMSRGVAARIISSISRQHSDAEGGCSALWSWQCLSSVLLLPRAIYIWMHGSYLLPWTGHDAANRQSRYSEALCDGYTARKWPFARISRRLAHLTTGRGGPCAERTRLADRPIAMIAVITGLWKDVEDHQGGDGPALLN